MMMMIQKLRMVEVGSVGWIQMEVRTQDLFPCPPLLHKSESQAQPQAGESSLEWEAEAAGPTWGGRTVPTGYQ